MKQKAKPSFAELFALMRRRQSIRKFADKALSEKQILKIISAGVTAPSSLNSQPWKFVVLKSAAKKKRLREIYTDARVKLKLYEQDTSFVEKATPIVVVCEDNSYDKIFSCAMAIQNMFLAAEAMGLGSLPSVTILLDMDSEKELAELIGVSGKEKIALVTYFGFKDEKPERKPKKEVKGLIVTDSLQ